MAVGRFKLQFSTNFRQTLVILRAKRGQAQCHLNTPLVIYDETHIENDELGRSEQFASDTRPFPLTAGQSAHHLIAHL